jgi:hypothetical protein
MSADILLARLDGVRRAGDRRWRARCPVHGSKGGTLSVREEADGRVLVHCFAGCGADEIVGAVGVDSPRCFPSDASTIASRAAPARRSTRARC